MCDVPWASRSLLADSTASKESACNAEDTGLIPGLGRSAGEGMGYPLQYSWASLVAQLVNNPPVMWETWVQSLGWKDPLEKGKATQGWGNKVISERRVEAARLLEVWLQEHTP